MQRSHFRDPGPCFGPLVKKLTICRGMGLGSATVRSAGVRWVSRTGAGVEPGLSRPEQKRRRVTWGKRCASVEVPVVLQIKHLGWFQHFAQSLFGESRPSNKLHLDLTSSTVHKAASACVLRSFATSTFGTCLIALVASGRKGYHCFLALTLQRKMPRRTKAQLARDKARKQVQNLFDKFRDPDGHLTGYSGHLLLDGPAYFDDNYLTHHQVKLLPFDVSDTAIPNSVL